MEQLYRELNSEQNIRIVENVHHLKQHRASNTFLKILGLSTYNRNACLMEM